MSALVWISAWLHRLADWISPVDQLPNGYRVRRVNYGVMQFAMDHPEGWSSYHQDQESAIRTARSIETRRRGL